MAFILNLGLARDQHPPLTRHFQCLNVLRPRTLTIDFMRWALGWALLLATTTLCAAALEPGTVSVLHVHDGDTLTVRTPQGQTLKVRIAAIDAPELRQAHGEFARQHLRALLQDIQPTLDCIKSDRYGRKVCRVFVGQQDLALAQVDAGAAWWYTQYSAEQSPADKLRYAEAQRQAQAAGRGLWADHAEAPWDWRKRIKMGQVR
jgi:endonuclease YncB( thermonuclease family)